jgi:hypothetical protein
MKLIQYEVDILGDLKKNRLSVVDFDFEEQPILLSNPGRKPTQFDVLPKESLID